MLKFTAGDELMRLNSHPVFDKVVRQGFNLWYRTEEDEESLGFSRLYVVVRLDGEMVGDAEFIDNKNDYGGPYCENVLVLLSVQRRGIANAMYRFAEAVLGKTLQNFWGGDPKQTKAAKAIWANPNRPFGPPLSGPTK